MEHNDETKQFLDDILARAENGDATKFQLINSWGEYLVCNRWRKATKIVLKVLRSSAKQIFKSYCTTVIAGISDATQLIAYAQLVDVIAFYEAELDTFDRMLDEYLKYLWHGNFIYALLGGERDNGTND